MALSSVNLPPGLLDRRLDPLPDASRPAAKAYADTAGNAVQREAPAGVKVSLSREASAAVAATADKRSLTEIVLAGRARIDDLLKKAGTTEILSKGDPTVDLGGLDRRTLWAIAANCENKFTLEERVVAALKLEEKRDAGLAGPAAAVRVSGDYAALYRAWLTNLDGAGAEERASAQWSEDKAAVLKGLDAAIARPGTAPSIDGDPVAAWLKKTGNVVVSPRTRDIDSIAADVRAVIDRQYAAHEGERGKRTVDFSRFDDRSLAAVALNKGAQFSAQEITQAEAEVRSRTWEQVSASAGVHAASDPSALGQSILTRYAAMSPEERSAAGWTEAFYDKVVEMQGLTERIRSMFGARPSLLDYL